MPEGPEAHTIADKLRSKLLQSLLVRVESRTSLCNRGFENIRTPVKVLEVCAYGKRVIMALEFGVIVTFLGMTGRWSWSPTDISHLVLTFKLQGLEDREGIETELHYTDTRRFGLVNYYTNQQEYLNYFAQIGPDLISHPPTLQQYSDKIAELVLKSQGPRKKKIATLTSWLMDQSHYSGVGNYLKSEILYHAGLDPRRTVDSLSPEEISRLYSSSLTLIRLSYQHGGLTLRDYWSPDGQMGTFPVQIYGKREGTDPQGHRILDYLDSDGRRTFWVPQLQH